MSAMMVTRSYLTGERFTRDSIRDSDVVLVDCAQTGELDESYLLRPGSLDPIGFVAHTMLRRPILCHVLRLCSGRLNPVVSGLMAVRDRIADATAWVFDGRAMIYEKDPFDLFRRAFYGDEFHKLHMCELIRIALETNKPGKHHGAVGFVNPVGISFASFPGDDPLDLFPGVRSMRAGDLLAADEAVSSFKASRNVILSSHP